MGSEALTNDGWPRRSRSAPSSNGTAWFYVERGGLYVYVDSAASVGRVKLSWRQIERAMAARVRAAKAAAEREVTDGK